MKVSVNYVHSNAEYVPINDEIRFKCNLISEEKAVDIQEKYNQFFAPIYGAGAGRLKGNHKWSYFVNQIICTA